MRICWAESLGGCGGGYSGEHIISKGLFTGKTVQVLGTPWKADEPKSIGINALTANILCSNHNSQLSIVDSEGKAAFHAIRRFEEIFSGRKSSSDNTDLKHEVCGEILERWFIKHAINLFIVIAQGRLWYNKLKTTIPPKDVVEAAFGIRPLKHPRGLYNWAGSKVSEKKTIDDQVEFVPIYNDNNMYVGAFFEFQALSFLIWLDDSSANEVPWTFVRDFYHHIGGVFEAPPLKAAFQVNWS